MQRMVFGALCCLAVFVATAAAVSAEQVVARELDIPDLRVGQRVMIDDGSCPAGQIKLVVGAQLKQTGVVRTRSCVPRIAKK